MKITLLGTGSCEGIPFLWCDCRVCTIARESDNRNRRARASLAINDDVLVDFGPDVRNQCLKYGINTVKTRQLIVTHSHVDHFRPEELLFRTVEYAKMPLEVIGDRCVLEPLKGKEKSTNLKLTEGVPGQWIRRENIAVFPVEATHCGPEEIALNYVIEDASGKRLLVASDTGWYGENTWKLLRNVKADGAVIEMSFGIRPPYDMERGTHLGAGSTIEMRDELVRVGALKQSAVTVATHVSHCSNATCDEIEQYFYDSGILAGYDGMTVNL